MVFGGRVVGPYVRHYRGQLECAFVKGWYQDVKCMCWLIDRSFGQDITFMQVNDEMCKKNFE